jgi:hypothetical protein
MNWLQELKYYHEFMGWNYDSDISKIKTQKQAKQQLIEDLEFIIGTNGWSELYDSERELANKLGIKE